MRRKAPSYVDDLRQRLQDEEYAADYLSEAINDEEAVFLLALRDVVEAHRMSRVARKSKLSRETLYRTLSEKGNPTLRTLSSVLDAIGLRLSVTRRQPAVPDERSKKRSEDQTPGKKAARVA